MAVNKVIYADETLIDLTNDTVTADGLLKGLTAHDAAGALITGMLESGGSSSVEVISGTFTPSQSDSYYEVTFDKPMSGTPHLIMFLAKDDRYDASTSRRTKGCIGIRDNDIIPYFATNGTTTSATSFYRRQLNFINNSTSGNNVTFSTGYYAITTTTTGASQNYGLIRKATKEGFQAWRHGSATYPFMGTYVYIAIKFY